MQSSWSACGIVAMLRQGGGCSPALKLGNDCRCHLCSLCTYVSGCQPACQSDMWQAFALQTTWDGIHVHARILSDGSLWAPHVPCRPPSMVCELLGEAWAVERHGAGR